MDDDYVLSLNASALVFFPPQREGVEDQVALENAKKPGYMRSELSGEQFYVTQAIVKIENRNTMIETLLFYRFQREITTAIEKLAYAHLLTPLPQEIDIFGDGFILCARRKPWPFGRRLTLYWADERITTCDDKWTFLLKAL